ncbi:MAG: choloylglycine hydrolase [Clostridia bacterium]|nr:choloylglycine hydrolase [Clostridia bacterium]
MCTAISFKTKDHYFGRTLDLDYHYNESVVITPRNYPFSFRNGREIKNHLAIIGIATVIDDYPLYYEATNEKGLSIAGLNFPHNAHYFPVSDNKENLAPFELIPWILGQFTSVDEVKENLNKINIADINFNKSFKNSPLHWLIADRDKSITVECVEEGLKIYDNPLGVLTNNPPFELQLEKYKSAIGTLGKEEADPKINSKGLDAFGLPGDLSSPSRFAKVAFAKEKSVCQETEEESVTQFFHILGTVNTPRGFIKDDYMTVYTSCCNTDKGIYYYTTYGNSQISAVDMNKESLDSDNLISYPLVTEQQINRMN